MLLFETTTDPALRRVYATIDYAANHAMVEICDIALNAYHDIWGRSACEKPACLRTYERQTIALNEIDAMNSGILRYHTSWRYSDYGQDFRYEIVEWPLDGQFTVQILESGDYVFVRDFDTLTDAIAYVEGNVDDAVVLTHTQRSVSHG